MKKAKNDITVATSQSPAATARDLHRPAEFQIPAGGDVPEIARIRVEVLDTLRGFFLHDQGFSTSMKKLESLQARAITSSSNAVLVLHKARKVIESCDTAAVKVRECLTGTGGVP